jgi:hypothetical protein
MLDSGEDEEKTDKVDENDLRNTTIEVGDLKEN